MCITPKQGARSARKTYDGGAHAKGSQTLHELGRRLDDHLLERTLRQAFRPTFENLHTIGASLYLRRQMLRTHLHEGTKQEFRVVWALIDGAPRAILLAAFALQHVGRN